MKLNINKACDLSSISVLPPHSRRSNTVCSGVDSSGSGKMQAHNVRSQSQQQYSQGMSLSQLSQGSIDEVFANDQKLGSQERDNTAKRLSCLVPITNPRDDSQMQQSRSSNYAARRWSSAFTPEPRCHVSEELEHKIGLVESSLNRLQRSMDSVQSDLMQVHKTVKEVSLEGKTYMVDFNHLRMVLRVCSPESKSVAGIWQKIIVQDGHMQIMLKREEDVKASIAETLKTIPDQLRKEAEAADQQKTRNIAAAISSLPMKIEACLLRLQNEVCGAFTKEIEKRSCVAASSQNNQPPTSRIATRQPTNYKWAPDLTKEAENLNALKPVSRFSSIKRVMKPKQEEVLLTELVDDCNVITESDEEIDGGFSCLLKKKEVGWESHLSEEARRESKRILMRARRRKRKLDNIIVLD